jgi:hypothetical protein
VKKVERFGSSSRLRTTSNVSSMPGMSTMYCVTGSSPNGFGWPCEVTVGSNRTLFPFTENEPCGTDWNCAP